MFNPTVLFNKAVLEATAKKGCYYFVRNTYKRALDVSDKTMRACFLITHYNDRAKANAHFNSITNDGNRFLYDWHNGEERQKLYIAASQPPGFRVYSTYFDPDFKKKLPRDFKDKINRYINKYTDLRPGRSNVNLDLYMQFGSLYATIGFDNQTIKVKFDDLEKL